MPSGQIHWPTPAIKYGLKSLCNQFEINRSIYPKKVFISGSYIYNRSRIMQFLVSKDYSYNTRYVCFYLSIRATKPKRHANVLLFDLQDRTWSLFDPRGVDFGWRKFPESLDAINDLIIDIRKYPLSSAAMNRQLMGITDWIYRPVIPELQPQVNIMERSTIGRGLCSFWSLWFIWETLQSGVIPEEVCMKRVKHLQKNLLFLL